MLFLIPFRYSGKYKKWKSNFAFKYVFGLQTFNSIAQSTFIKNRTKTKQKHKQNNNLGTHS